MRKITFDALPLAIAEILERLDRVEQLLNGKTPSKTKVKKLETTSTAESIDIKEAAKMLNVSVASLYTYVKNNSIPFEKTGRKLTFSRTALETWKKEKKNGKKKISKKISGKKGNGKKVKGKKGTDKKVITVTPGELITPQEAEKIFNKPLPSIYYLIRTRKLQAVKKKGREQYYSKDELTKALKVRQKRSAKKPS